MDSSPSSWPRRFLAAVPPMSDGLWAGVVLLLVLLLSFTAGLTWCGWSQRDAVQRISVQHQLDAFDKRLKAVESP